MANEKPKVDSDFEGRLKGQRLTTLEVLYWRPSSGIALSDEDKRKLVSPSNHIIRPGEAVGFGSGLLGEPFIWQTLDHVPDFPRIQQFLEFWKREVEAVIHSVNIAVDGEAVRPAAIGNGYVATYNPGTTRH
ncbi:MAG: hypothetical protein AB7G06_09240 [Bdellovibrionales bacterium]